MRDVTDKLETLRQEVLRSWTMAQRMAVVTTKEDVDRVARKSTRERNAVVTGRARSLPETGWKPFQELLEQFEAAVREDERGRARV